jgi:hypothetical protein
LISIDGEVFRNNKITSIVIPNTVKYIGYRAFFNNELNKISIGSDVQIAGEAFDNDFIQFYESNGKKAGVYRLINNNWSFTN